MEQQDDRQPHELSRLTYPWMEIACNAIFISSGEVSVLLQENESGEPELVLDAAPYEKTKRIYEGLQRKELLLKYQKSWQRYMENHIMTSAGKTASNGKTCNGRLRCMGKRATLIFMWCSGTSL